ncbi:MAG TPA: helix-turn-helix transcriptional regulator [Nevskiaceae bacterium]|nr:helix-turn-helix transcriptional regulator [Nevskiaceae bacterium]
MSEPQELPFQPLGQRLKKIRTKMQESVAEVSGAVEIDMQALERIEQGRERPSEDILMLLISHFGMHDDEAAGLWELAGYDPPRDHDHEPSAATQSSRNMVLVMAIDPRIVYSDGVQVQASSNGVVMSFSQASGTQQQLTTARVGMSREQANNVMRAMQDALGRSEPRQLPASTSDSQQPQNSDQSTNKK